MTSDRKIAFQYEANWLKNGFAISPFSLPLSNEVFVPQNNYFDGLFGVFSDSLPDAWGRLVLDRMLEQKGIKASELDSLDRLAIVGNSAMGALEYVPEFTLSDSTSSLSIDELSVECSKLLASQSSNKINELFTDCGSSGGARPKALIKLNDEDWIIKFIYSKDAENTGVMEYDYYLCARECGITMSESKLIDTKAGKKFFATKRFDRPKMHMLSAAAALEIDFERSLTDYSQLFKLTNILSNGNKADLIELFRRMCFNVFSFNQDDHLKNFAYLYDDKQGIWRLSPAYDLTYCITGYGEHTTTINGKGHDITAEDLLAVAKDSGLNLERSQEEMSKIEKLCNDRLSKYFGKLGNSF